MIEINLLPPEFRRKDRFKVGVPDLPYIKILLTGAAVFLGLQLALAGFAAYQHVELGAVRAEAERARIENAPIEQKKKELAGLKKEITRVEALTRRPVYWSRLLHEITQTMTKGVWLRSLSIDVPRDPAGPASAATRSAKARREASPRVSAEPTQILKIEGSAVGQGQETALIGKYIKEMKENGLFAEVFEDIQLVNINQRKIKEYDVYDFVLHCRFRKDRGRP